MTRRKRDWPLPPRAVALIFVVALSSFAVTERMTRAPSRAEAATASARTAQFLPAPDREPVAPAQVSAIANGEASRGNPADLIAPQPVVDPGRPSYSAAAAAVAPGAYPLDVVVNPATGASIYVADLLETAIPPPPAGSLSSGDAGGVTVNPATGVAETELPLSDAADAPPAPPRAGDATVDPASGAPMPLHSPAGTAQ